MPRFSVSAALLLAAANVATAQDSLVPPVPLYEPAPVLGQRLEVPPHLNLQLPPNAQQAAPPIVTTPAPRAVISPVAPPVTYAAPMQSSYYAPPQDYTSNYPTGSQLPQWTDPPRLPSAAPAGSLHQQFPYYSYRRPWYTPGPASLNATIVW